MKVFVRGMEDECEACCKRDVGMWYGEARWRDAPQTYECSNCRKVTSEWEPGRTDKLTPPDEPRSLTDAECRSIGWICEGDDTCSTCGLGTYDGQYPLCEGCGNCEECVGGFVECSCGISTCLCSECRKEADVVCEP